MSGRHYGMAILTGLALLLAVPAAAQLAGNRLEDLGWLAGSWEGEGGDVRTEEHYTHPAGGMILGMHRTVRTGKPAFWEHIRIVEEGGAILYLASPLGAAPTPFRLVEMAPGRAVFENPDNDFPRTITYVRQGDRLTCTIAGQDGAGAESWTWKHVSAARE